MNVPLSLLRRRRFVQAATLAGLCVLPWLNAGGWTAVVGNMYALRLGSIPLADPVAAAQVAAAGEVPGWSLYLGSLLTLVLALAAGRFFCGWLCPYGLLSEWLWRRRKNETGRSGPHPWRWRAALTAVGLAGTALWGAPLLNVFSAPGLISLAPQLGAAAGTALFPVAGMLALEGITGRRWWCRALCPQALPLMAAAWCGRRLPFRLAARRRSGRCSCGAGEAPCATACSLGLNPRGKAEPSAALCTQCGDCVVSCAGRGGVLRLGGPDRKH